MERHQKYRFRDSKGRYIVWEDELKRVVQEATKIGEEACKYALEHKDYYLPTSKHKATFNIQDAIGSGVYVRGVLDKNSLRYATNPEKSLKPYQDKTKVKGEKKGKKGGKKHLVKSGMITGREALAAYWEAHPTISKQNVVEVVCVAATFYSGILESKGIRVISAVADYMQSKMTKFSYYKPTLRKLATG